jgi:hypothetical protein
MATNYKVLGQSNPSATTATTLYTVPSATETVVSTITVCNQTTAGSYRIAIRPDGETLAAKHYIAYDVAIGANAQHSYTIGATLNAADVITVYASSGSQSFNAFGSEIA